LSSARNLAADLRALGEPPAGAGVAEGAVAAG
jgi:hypothetical protein